MKKWMMVLLSLCLSLSLFTACSNQEENEEATASPTAAATATPTAESAETPESTSEATPTTAPEEDPDADPEVDAMLFRFWTEGEYGWINIDSTVTHSNLLVSSYKDEARAYDVVAWFCFDELKSWTYSICCGICSST